MRINVVIADELNKKLDDNCVRYGCSKSDLVSVIIGRYYESIDNIKLPENGSNLSNELLKLRIQKKKK